MVQTVVKEFGGVDILVNNAAWTDHKTIFDITEEEWDRTMNVCMRSVWYCTRAAAKVMIDQKRKGRIVNIASTSGHWGRKEATAYTTAKAGVLNLTRSIAVQLAPEGIRVNSVSPNRIGSPVGQQDVPENRFVKNLAGRRGVPMDIAKAVVFMVSDESEFIYADRFAGRRRRVGDPGLVSMILGKGGGVFATSPPFFGPGFDEISPSRVTEVAELKISTRKYAGKHAKGCKIFSRGIPKRGGVLEPVPDVC